MKIILNKKDNKTVGYDLIPENTKDKLILGSIRNLHFFGLDETVLQYDGIETEENYVTKIKFIQKQFVE